MKETGKGQETRNRLLMTAAGVFADKGYRGTTIRDICGRARTNVAAVKYYFGSKQGLYLETFRYLFVESEQRLDFYTRPLQITSAVAWESALRDWVHTLVSRTTSDVKADYQRSRLFLWEHVQPSVVLPIILREYLRPIRSRLIELLRLGLPEGVSESELQIWCTTTLAQCTVYSSRTRAWRDLLIPEGVSRSDWVDLVTRQVTEGITARLRFRGAATVVE